MREIWNEPESGMTFDEWRRDLLSRCPPPALAGAFHRLLETEWYRNARVASSAKIIGGLSDAQ